MILIVIKLKDGDAQKKDKSVISLNAPRIFLKYKGNNKTCHF